MKKTFTVNDVVEKIFEGLQKQKFADWYNEGGDFDHWITGDLPAIEDEEIKNNIKSLFFLNK